MGKRSARAFDGAHGWKLRPGRDGKPDVKPYTRQEETYAFRAQSFDGPLIDYQAKGSTVVLEGIDEIEGHRAYRLSVQLASGETDRVWIDEQSYLEIRYDRPSYAPGAKPSTVSVFYRDYKPIEDLQIPMTIETAAAPGQSPDRLLIERVMMNAPLEERTFAAPGTAGRRRSGLSMNPLTGPPAPVAPAAPASAEPQVPPFASSPDPRSGSK